MDDCISEEKMIHFISRARKPRALPVDRALSINSAEGMYQTVRPEGGAQSERENHALCAWVSIKKIKPKTWLFVLIVIYTILLSYISILRHQNYYSYRYDLGNMEQVVWNTIHGRIFEFTDPEGVNNISRLKYHADFLLLPIAIIYKLFPQTETLLILQSFFISIGIIPVYYLAKEILKKGEFVFIPVLAYLFYPALQRSNYYDFHAVSFATSFLLFALYFLSKKKYFTFILFSILAIFTKEQIPVTVAFLSFYGAVKNRQFRKVGLIFSALCLIYFYIIFFLVIPSYQVNSWHFVFKYFIETNSSSGGSKLVLNTILSDKNVWWLLIRLFAPLLFLPFLSPAWLLFILPDLIPRLLSQNNSYRSIDFQYNNSIIPFIFMAFIFGLKKYFDYFRQKRIGDKIASVPVMTAIIISYCLWSPFSGQIKNIPAKVILQPRPEKYFIDNFKATISENKSVCVTNNLGSHFAKREYLYDFPNNIFKADYVLILKEGNVDSDEWLLKKIELLKRNTDYQKVTEYKNFIAFRKLSDNTKEN